MKIFNLTSFLQNCQLEQDQNSDCVTVVAPPPLTPINALKSVTTQSTVLPTLQRIPRSGDVLESKSPEQPEEPSVNSELPPLTKESNPISETDTTHVVSRSENKSIVGSVTTWFPPSSTIQVSQEGSPNQTSDSRSIAPPPRPQHVEFLGNKKFLIIPRHNIVSVSPTITTNAAAPSNKFSNPNSIQLLSLNVKEATEGSANIHNKLDSASLGPNMTGSFSPSKPTDCNLGIAHAQEMTTNGTRPQETDFDEE